MSIEGISALNPYPPYEPCPPDLNPIWWPANSAQQAFLNCDAELALFGGMSGGGKSDSLVADAQMEHHNPSLKALMIRESLGEMQQLNDRMEKVYSPLGARWRGRIASKAWMFPAGGFVRPGYLAHDKHIKRYRGNPYSWLGVDESGLHPENRIREMVGWLAAPVGSGLRVRGRFGSNPGGVGQVWQGSVFLRNKCPIHFPADPEDSKPTETSVFPGYVYGGFMPGYSLKSPDPHKYWLGSRWASDDAPVFKTVAFFPSSLRDNPFYDDTKIASLLSQTAAIRAQLLDGCWCNADGLYFDFLRTNDFVPYAKVNDQWWLNHFLSIDYGYGNSAAAVGQYTVMESGMIAKTRERVERKMSSQNFAKAICSDGFPESAVGGPKQAAWVTTKLRESDPQRPKYSFVVIDRANDKHSGEATGKSNYEIMQEVFSQYGIPCVKADSKDSMGNAQALYNGLANHTLVLTDQTPKTMKCLTTRVIDERRSVKKIHGDPLDDIYDETSYGYNTWVANSIKPDRIKLAEDLARMKEHGADDTTLARYAWQREQAIQDKEARIKRGVSLLGPRIGNVRVKR